LALSKDHQRHADAHDVYKRLRYATALLTAKFFSICHDELQCLLQACVCFRKMQLFALSEATTQLAKTWLGSARYLLISMHHCSHAGGSFKPVNI